MTKTAVPASAIASAPVKAARDIGLDITRIFAFLCVVSVHFLIGSRFYDNPLTGEKMYVMTLIRTFSMVCVPLFLLLTGYLTCGRNVELTPRGYLKYTAKLRHVLLTYLFASLFVQLYCKVMTDVTMTFGTAMKNVLGFSQYGWYVEMYIGLFLLTPFLSLLLKNLDRRALTVFIAVLSVLTVAPSVFNVFNFFSSGNFISGGADKIIPQWWEKLYPVTYWFIGAYMRKYVEIKKLNTFRLFFARRDFYAHVRCVRYSQIARRSFPRRHPLRLGKSSVHRALGDSVSVRQFDKFQDARQTFGRFFEARFEADLRRVYSVVCR